MKRLLLALTLAFALLGGAPHPVSAQSIFVGQVAGGYYKVAVPAEEWNGDLVIWNHGYSFAPVAPFSVTPENPLDGLGPLAALQLAEGYAVAASSYRQTGWALFKSRNDLEALMAVIHRKVGRPAHIFVTGASLGGLVTIDAIERANLGNVVGGLTMCGALAGSRNWDAAVDLRLVYDAVCASTPGAFIPGGAAGLPADVSVSLGEIVAAVQACTGVLAPPPLRTAEQQERLSTLLTVLRVPEEFLLTDMLFATMGLADLVHDPTKLAGHIGTGNVNVDYDDPVINETVARVAPNRGAAHRLRRHYTPTGDVGDVRIVSLHTDKDGLVAVENESSYASLAPAPQFTSAIVVEDQPTHCGFTPAEVLASWESLRAWVAGGPQPTPETLQGMCTAAAPDVGGPCRIDPAFVTPELDSRIRPR